MPTQHQQPRPTIPVSVITGFLGSGKTTLLNQLIKHSAMDKVAVLINEFGEIGLDHLLVETVSEDIVLLQSGCICCQVKDDLANTLLDLMEKRNSSEIEAFERILIETTGVADPVPVVQVLMADPQLAPYFRLEGVITLVDGQHGLAQLRDHGETVKQTALADILVVTKTDLVERNSLQALTERLLHLNPTAKQIMAVKGEAHPQTLFQGTQPNRDIAQWLPTETTSHNHHESIASACITLDTPLDWGDFSEWLNSLIFSRAEHLLRIKGVLNIVGKDRPVIIHGVQHTFYPPTELPSWPTDQRDSRLVVITYNLNPRAIENSLREFLTPRPLPLIPEDVCDA